MIMSEQALHLAHFVHGINLAWFLMEREQVFNKSETWIANAPL